MFLVQRFLKLFKESLKILVEDKCVGTRMHRLISGVQYLAKRVVGGGAAGERNDEETEFLQSSSSRSSMTAMAIHYPRKPGWNGWPCVLAALAIAILIVIFNFVCGFWPAPTHVRYNSFPQLFTHINICSYILLM